MPANGRWDLIRRLKVNVCEREVLMLRYEPKIENVTGCWIQFLHNFTPDDVDVSNAPCDSFACNAFNIIHTANRKREWGREKTRERERTVRHLATSRGTAMRCYGNIPLASDPRAPGSITPPPALQAVCYMWPSLTVTVHFILVSRDIRIYNLQTVYSSILFFL